MIWGQKLFFGVMALFASCVGAADLKIAFFDTTLSSVSPLKKSAEILGKIGASVQYYSLFGGAVDGVGAFCGQCSDVAVFMLSQEVFLAKKTSFMLRRLLDAVKHAATIPGGIVVFSLPALPSNSESSFWATFFSQLFSAAGLHALCDVWAEGDFAHNRVAKEVFSFISNNSAFGNLAYHTMLKLPGMGGGKHKSIFSVGGEREALISLPLVNSERSLLLSSVGTSLPFGLWCYDKLKKNAVVFVSGEALGAGEVKESFMVYPMDRAAQRAFELAVACFWQDVVELSGLAGVYDPQKINDALKKTINAAENLVVHQKVANKKCLVKTAWMELVVFEEPDDLLHAELAQKREAQHELVDSVLMAGISPLWLGISPQMVYGVHAKNPEKKKVFQEGIARFVKKLKQRSGELAKKVPKLFIGFEIANNLYGSHLPSEPAVDVYGTISPDVPSPVAIDFWRDEVIDPLKQFVSFYRKSKLDREIDLSGIVIDLELYGRKKASEFSPLMLGASRLLKNYVSAKKLTNTSVDDVMSELAVKNLFSDYVSFAGVQAAECGRQIRKCVDSVISGGEIMCYMPVFSLNWFTNAFCKELSGGSPLHVFTFTSAFEKKKKIVEAAFGCSVVHSSVLMLSKLTGDTYPWFFNEILVGNDGCWFNRWSRFAEPADKKAWHFIEQPQIFGSAERKGFYDFLFRQ